MDLSLIIPSYNEEASIRAFFARATACFDATDLEYELIFVDDGSADATLAHLHSLVNEYQGRGSIQVISFSRNFGKEPAMFAGLEKAKGDFVGFIDADLQQLPEISLEMYTYLQENPDFDCVAAVQEERREGAVLKFFKNSFYRIFNVVGDTELTANASDFRVFKRTVRDALLAMPEYYRFSKGLFSWIGFRTHTITYSAEERFGGTTNWSFTKLMKYALGGIMSFTTWPLKVAFYLGTITFVAALILLIMTLVEYLFMGTAVPGYPTIVCLLLLFNGILMIILGVFGEYLGRIYIQGKNRPIYISREEFSYTREELSDNSVDKAGNSNSCEENTDFSKK